MEVDNDQQVGLADPALHLIKNAMSISALISDSSLTTGSTSERPALQSTSNGDDAKIKAPPIDIPNGEFAHEMEEYINILQTRFISAVDYDKQIQDGLAHQAHVKLSSRSAPVQEHRVLRQADSNLTKPDDNGSSSLRTEESEVVTSSPVPKPRRRRRKADADEPSIDQPKMEQTPDKSEVQASTGARNTKSTKSGDTEEPETKEKTSRSRRKRKSTAASSALPSPMLPPDAPSTPSVKKETAITSKSNGKELHESSEGTESETDDHNNLDPTKAGHPRIRLVPLKAPKALSQKEEKAISRVYQSAYDAIWRDMARKEASKIHKLIQSSLSTKQVNARKTSQLAAKEARRWQARTNKNIKDVQGRARRANREMLAFWKRNEREERDLRRKAEKEAIEKAKKEEEMRESQRQSRKLNFLITQTELYSHFIGRKIKSEDAESEAPVAKDVTSLDFDAADDDELRQAAMHNAQSAVLSAQEKARSFGDDGSQDTSAIPKEKQDPQNANIDGDEMNFQNPTSLGDITIHQPKLLTCQLKEYQVKGLSWLANLYEQGINGILADEMGLGKTVQSISVMAYLAETHNIWGPFLVIAPASTLHNWQQEIAKFVPEFKALPYWGDVKDRRTLRKFWDRKQLRYTKDSPFHVLITSYQLIVADTQYFQRMRWQYMILDEAQAIKSSSSSRWKSLLSLQCRNRLLLTGTPIQNTMQELWALLHFIMPSLFDSHDEFSEWFSKDIESHAQSNTQLNEQQLKRLHMILKPFMLRRVKKHVQQELGDKVEIDVYCKLTNRQRMLYNMLRSQISLYDLLEKAQSGSDDSTQSLMNLVMQFRKVCNHPNLFERADVDSAYSFAVFGKSATTTSSRDNSLLELSYSAKNPISFTLPALFYRDGGIFAVPSESNNNFIRQKLTRQYFNLWDSSYLHQLYLNEPVAGGWLCQDHRALRCSESLRRAGLWDQLLALAKGEIESRPLIHVRHTEVNECLLDSVNSALDSQEKWSLIELCSISSNCIVDGHYTSIDPAYDPRALAPPIDLWMSHRGCTIDQESLYRSRVVLDTLYPLTLDQEWDFLSNNHASTGTSLPVNNLLGSLQCRKAGLTTIKMPSMFKFVKNSGKLSRLDALLADLKANDHRVLIYFQMTKMMDLMEEYLTFRQYKYCRLDGSSKLSDRRDLVNDWQTKPSLFVFLLSTRAGGLGINLTAADTVIFYDSDWNPTIDSQAMDRAHRLGQTKQVTVYRLLVKGTIEERMRNRAKQKMHVQSVVMEGKTGSSAKTLDLQKSGREVAYWLLNDEDSNEDTMVRVDGLGDIVSSEQAGLKRESSEDTTQVKKKSRTGGSV